MRILRTAVYLILGLLAAATGSLGQTSRLSEPAKSCRDVAQSFYDWYVPMALKEKEMSSSDVAVRDKASLFSPELVRALNEDSQAQKKTEDEIVGLDFDPFLNTQDLAQHYVLRNVTAKGDKCMVDVHSVESGQVSPKPDVVAELARKDGKWVFVNFHYGKSQESSDENLVAILRKLRQDREQHK
jgi:hypothetical protein